MQICIVLGVEIPGGSLDEMDLIGRRLQKEILNAWDKTPEDARHLVRLLKEVSALSQARRSARR
jgi:hypothetical protein